MLILTRMKKGLVVFGKVMMCLFVFLVVGIGGIWIYVAIPLRAEVGGFYLGEDTCFDQVRDMAGASIRMRGCELRVLVLTDTHFLAIPVGVDGRTRRLIRDLVKETEPELILMLGDNVATFFNHSASRQMIRFMDGFGIPWAPLFGNHDHHGKATSEYLAQMLERESTYSLFRWGPNNVGLPGNYFINVERVVGSELVDDEVIDVVEVVHTFFMMSTKESPWFQWRYTPYTLGQVAWYEWAVRGIANRYNGGEVVPSTLMLHKPLPVFCEAWDWAVENSLVVWGDNREGIWAADYDNGLFRMVYELGSTRYVIAGHDHINDFKIYFQGEIDGVEMSRVIRLSYALASNRNLGVFGSYGHIAGGTLLRVGVCGTVVQEGLRLRGGVLVWDNFEGLATKNRG